jgi:hypothetical protein
MKINFDYIVGSIFAFSACFLLAFGKHQEAVPLAVLAIYFRISGKKG